MKFFLNLLKQITMAQAQTKQPRIIEYRLIAANSQEDIEFEVNKRINEANWQPYGTPFTMQDTVFQAIVKYDETK